MIVPVKTFKELINEIMDDHLYFIKDNKLVNKDNNLLCSVKEYNDILRYTTKKIFNKYPSYILIRDIEWDEFFDDRFHTSSCTSLIWGEFKKPKNSVDYMLESPPTHITDFYSMDGEFIEEATKAYKHLCKHYYPNL